MKAVERGACVRGRGWAVGVVFGFGAQLTVADGAATAQSSSVIGASWQLFQTSHRCSLTFNGRRLMPAVAGAKSRVCGLCLIVWKNAMAVISSLATSSCRMFSSEALLAHALCVIERLETSEPLSCLSVDRCVW